MIICFNLFYFYQFYFCFFLLFFAFYLLFYLFYYFSTTKLTNLFIKLILNNLIIFILKN